ncbi:hypothetical protein, partial [Thermogutta sp.]|uniref:hypothetical protein n=1 Tax=Thermogutta sp. TaxID=1962930 RepID=UPI00322027E1
KTPLAGRCNLHLYYQGGACLVKSLILLVILLVLILWILWLMAPSAREAHSAQPYAHAIYVTHIYGALVV